MLSQFFWGAFTALIGVRIKENALKIVIVDVGSVILCL